MEECNRAGQPPTIQNIGYHRMRENDATVPEAECHWMHPLTYILRISLTCTTQNILAYTKLHQEFDHIGAKQIGIKQGWHGSQ